MSDNMTMADGTARKGRTAPPVRRMKAVACEFKFTIDPEFYALLPPLTEEERSLLEADIIANGCHHPLVVWGSIIVDGHNRYEICRRNNLTPSVVARDFADRDEAKVWIIRNQFGRRNLQPFQRAELALQLEPLIAKKAKENMRTSTGGADPRPLQKSVKPVDRQKELAEIAGVSHDTIARAKVIIREAPEETKGKLRKGEVSINSVYKAVHASKARNRKPDFRKISPTAARPIRGHSNTGLPIAVTLPQDPKKAVWALSRIFTREFVLAMAQEMMEPTLPETITAISDPVGAYGGNPKIGIKAEIAQPAITNTSEALRNFDPIGDVLGSIVRQMNNSEPVVTTTTAEVV